MRLTPLFLALGLLACGKKEGSACTGNQSLCADKTTELLCRGDKLVKVSCKGPLGCSKFQDHANCDDSVAEPGDICTVDDEYACTPDKGRALHCVNGKYERYLECRGKGKCTQLGQQVQCDTSIADKGDLCKTQGQVACTSNSKEMVICRDGKFASYRFCRGELGCANNAANPSCDESISMEGDPCGLPGQVVCSIEKDYELVCQGGTFAKSIACRKHGCQVSNGPGRPISCD